jgi:hypothetical protein
MENKRQKQEKKTIQIMIGMFCHANHGTRKNELCFECSDLLQYAQERIDRCPYQDKKSVCSICKVHCYRKEKQEQIRNVMRFGGPRMIFSHPIIAIQHLLKKKKQIKP